MLLHVPQRTAQPPATRLPLAPRVSSAEVGNLCLESPVVSAASLKFYSFDTLTNPKQNIPFFFFVFSLTAVSPELAQFKFDTRIPLKPLSPVQNKRQLPSSPALSSPNLAMNWLSSPSPRRSQQPGPLLPGWTAPTEHSEMEQ